MCSEGAVHPCCKVFPECFAVVGESFAFEGSILFYSYESGGDDREVVWWDLL